MLLKQKWRHNDSRIDMDARPPHMREYVRVVTTASGGSRTIAEGLSTVADADAM
jgi:hypothetical protein